MRHAPRVVLDTNVVVSALLFTRGRLAPLRLAWQNAAFQPLASRATTEELIRVLSYPKFKLDADDQRELLADYLPYCAVIAMPAKPPRTPPCRDPADLAFLQLAVAGKADFLVTGDEDLLGIKGDVVCPIISAGAFLDKLSDMKPVAGLLHRPGAKKLSEKQLEQDIAARLRDEDKASKS